VNQLFVKYPRLGRWGYDFIRRVRLGFHRPTRNTRTFLKEIRERGFAPNSILDVGANCGEWSRIARSVFKEADFFLIEPQVEMKPFLDKLCADWPGSRWFQAGAGARESELLLTLWDDLIGSSFLPGPSRELEQAGKQRPVPIITIDALIQRAEIPTPDLVKIDVQGFELEVLKGATNCFGPTQAFIVEASLFSSGPNHPVFHQVVNFMLEQGYVAYDFVDLKQRPFDGALGQVDVCFVKQDGLFRTSSRWD
jgi:FkbM family methyltransferase